MAGYWDKKILGIEKYKVQFFWKWLLYRLFGLSLPKMKDQKAYWNTRGHQYIHDIIDTGFGERERFFQDLLVHELRERDFSSIFEAGCGFGWNLRLVKETFPQARVGGVDFSRAQLSNGEGYISGHEINMTEGDICSMPFADDEFDIGFSMGVFMNIHQRDIVRAARQMIRVCKKWIIHIEYDENHTTDALRKKRSFKPNIISHDYRAVYEQLGMTVEKYLTYRDFGGRFADFVRSLNSEVDRWEGFEGAEKYIVAVIAVDK